MEKLTLTTKDLIAENIAKLSVLFPEIITEVEKDGKTVKTINADKLKELIGDYADNSNEVYELNWVGKQKSRQKIVMPINKTLRPVVEDSVDFENTENLYIEGDNFEVLKLLQESYLNKVKMIYIDPPYNTGKDFVYKDNFAMSREEYDDEAGVIDEEGNKLFLNTTTNGRFHSDWLSMMYERLVIAKDLLRDDGVIFISIGEDEVHNLRKVCDEIFGDQNFIGEAGRISKKANNQGDFWAPNFDYVLTYSKDKESCSQFFGGINYKAYKEIETEGERVGEKYQLIRLYMTSLDPMRGCKNQRYYIKCPDGSFVIPPGDNFPGNVDDGAKIEPKSGKDKVWRWGTSSYLGKKEQLFIKKVKSSNLVDEKGAPAKWNVYTKTYLKDVIENSTASPNNFIENHLNQSSSHELKKLEIPFDFAKPSSLIKFLAETCVTKENDLILDFFSGSATTAHAVMQLNAENGGNRKFIMVQLPEQTDENSDAFKAGYGNIAEIGKERIRRAAKKIQEENTDKDLSNVDFGFRAFKLDSSNMKDVYYNPNDIDQRTLSNFKDNIKEDRNDKDLLYQVLLEMGLPISGKVNEETVNNKTIYRLNDNFLIACFDDDVDLETVMKIAELKPLRLVFKDSSFKDDAAKVNCYEYLKNKLPNAIIKVI